jgi:hypothetical protein
MERTLTSVFALALLLLQACGGAAGEPPPPPPDTLAVDTTPPPPPPRRTIAELSVEELLAYARRNPCYLPLVRDSAYWQAGGPIGYSLEQLFNDRLPDTNRFRNRYLVGDMDSTTPDSTARGVQERYPRIRDLQGFATLDSLLVERLEVVGVDTPEEELDSLRAAIRAARPDSAGPLVNYIDKVWRYRTRPIERRHAATRSKVYAAGQVLCACEVVGDTLVEVARFAISTKRQSPSGAGALHESWPLGDRRHYYAGRYRITSKNWERQRKYDEWDALHDSAVGGGNTRVTFYKGIAELPNFLLMDPAEEYPRAMSSNGIHECALSELARGMLGAPNSIGCVRVTDFGSKFLRWFTPQDCNFFIAYTEAGYLRMEEGMDPREVMPFRTQEDGDRFRAWLNNTRPAAAERLEVDPTGSHESGHLVDAYLEYRTEYDRYADSLRRASR